MHMYDGGIAQHACCVNALPSNCSHHGPWRYRPPPCRVYLACIRLSAQPYHSRKASGYQANSTHNANSFNSDCCLSYSVGALRLAAASKLHPLLNFILPSGLAVMAAIMKPPRAPTAPFSLLSEELWLINFFPPTSRL
jgi:hypothetical protein